MITARFWGVRGSVPAPLTPAQVQEKIKWGILGALRDRELSSSFNERLVEEWLAKSNVANRATYGGNTTCVEVRVGGELVILDMGTGLRELGLGLMGETIKKGGLKGTILQSHVHWDHIQGYPFWPQLYMPRAAFRNDFAFYGGLDWEKSLHLALRDQMSSPMFPVPHLEIEQTGMRMGFNTVHDGKKIEIRTQGDDDMHGPTPAARTVLCRKLNHPQETYGYRLEYGGKILVFATDHEPYGGKEPHRGLLALAKDADVFITDCQYTLDEYDGAGGKVQKHGWGHSYPEYIARVADMAKVKKVVTTHHDPQASDVRIEEIARAVEELSGITTVPAYEGLVLEC